MRSTGPIDTDMMNDGLKNRDRYQRSGYRYRDRIKKTWRLGVFACVSVTSDMPLGNQSFLMEGLGSIKP